jgi:putative aldouronate transport system permease protein
MFYGNFDLFFNLTRDSKLLYPTTDVIDTFVYRTFRTMGDIGMASAAGAYQAFVGLIIVFCVNYIVRKINPDNVLF